MKISFAYFSFIWFSLNKQEKYNNNSNKNIKFYSDNNQIEEI